jgi:hypothetical protein
MESILAKKHVSKPTNQYNQMNFQEPTRISYILPQTKPYEDAINHAPKEKKSFS